ncbi:hypothetical protein A2380_00545 [candidate division WWE3 bacterium RIFOXYB1_FULL_43_24]|uniref:Uncharacterized protein n=2 Tax=Katanobacteria TaxID=422282 RepID=A0A0G0YRD8_UNCKA|nr:MAG: hypothetical protein UU92_C0005G0038 [candidate division WWE3 bacterium GW2011_GWA1_42_12]KKS34852.1 MAG: hypothetical protein UU97_C0005G0018 [candidate division WWE3 bacterium GW2011_GWD1_42_14]KKS39207.1 MAG: hypothetical protein UV00_C0003G0039 [candidate division WWE3 bacterium GW2011_GWF1_42_14]KKS40705.1 MAG: hypothetical protein UV03_C0003G0018 [candidate division WWE3 bacterium GW2011_GWE1_42_16]KKS66860.1 MAG: hypothetical protein UV35_C0006G0039 [candidate division WWE3 bacte
METLGEILSQIYVVSGVCVTIFFIIRGFVLARKEVKKHQLSSFSIVLLIVASSIVFIGAIYCWTAIISYVF